MARDKIKFLLDERIVEVDFWKFPELKPTTTVLNYLRSYPAHKGVKEGCSEGDCGACTIVVAEPGNEGKLVYKALDSCLVFLPMIHGKQLITVENLAVRENGRQLLHPVQQMLADTNGTQCGYCTPGIVMSLFALYKNHQNPSREIILDALTGNLCRCTGYQPILEAAMKVCIHHGQDHFSGKEKEVLGLLTAILANKETLEIRTPRQTYHKPFTLAEALRLRIANPNAVVTNGATDIALRQTKKKEFLEEILDLSSVDELKTYREESREYFFGAGLTLEQIKGLSAGKLPALYNILSLFGSLQIRNLATIGGNVGSASPIGDLLPLLFATGASVVTRSASAERKIPIETFITGYRETQLQGDELITGIRIPWYRSGTRIATYKVSKRRDLDISTVSSAFRVNLRNGVVDEIAVVFGGMAEMTKHCRKAEKYLIGKEWSRPVVEQAMRILDEEFHPISDARSGDVYRKKAAKNLLLKFYVDTAKS